jgi:hypothetical protein
MMLQRTTAPCISQLYLPLDTAAQHAKQAAPLAAAQLQLTLHT